MKVLLLPIALLILINLSGCSTFAPVTADRCSKIVSDYAVQIDAGKKPLADVQKESVGESGFFYVLSDKGILLVHPSQVLVGRDFSEIPQIHSILLRDKGSQSDDLGGMARTVFFRRLSSGSMLCLTINTAEIQSDAE